MLSKIKRLLGFGRVSGGREMVLWGDFYRTKPIGAHFFSRGKPVDRFYIERFLMDNREYIKGTVLEVENPDYTVQFGGGKVAESIVLHNQPGNPNAHIVGDLCTGEGIPKDRFDCIILTQVFLVLPDVRAAISVAAKALKRNGVLLVTVPGISQIVYPGYKPWGDYWRFTSLSLQMLLEEEFGNEAVTTVSYGNVLSATAFLHNLCLDDVEEKDLLVEDPNYQVTIGAVAIKRA